MINNPIVLSLVLLKILVLFNGFKLFKIASFVIDNYNGILKLCWFSQERLVIKDRIP